MTTSLATPTLKEELDRKVFETVEYLVNAVKKGRMTPSQVSAALDTLFMAVNGLVGGDFIEIFTEAQSVVGGDKSPVKRHFALPGKDITLSVSWTPGSSDFASCQRESGYATGGAVKSFDSVADAANAFWRLGDHLEKKGWVEL